MGMSIGKTIHHHLRIVDGDDHRRSFGDIADGDITISSNDQGVERGHKIGIRGHPDGIVHRQQRSDEGRCIGRVFFVG